MLFNLALKNIRKSIKDYGIYFFTLVIAVAIFYLFNSIDAQESMMDLTTSKHKMIEALIMILGYVSIFVSVILGFLIIYSNNFLIRRRKKEIGLYLTLGMSKRKVSTVLVLETLFVGLISLVVGSIVGVCLSQLLSVFTAHLFEADMTNYTFIFSSMALIKTIVYFGIIFMLVMIFNVIALSRYQLIDLLNASKKSEKVKVRNKYVVIISFILTILFLGYAYYLLFNGALLKFDNTCALMLIFGAIGTLLLFFSISGVLLQIFQRNKKVYYKDLNMFVLRQINSKVNTSIISTSVISLMLLFTIAALSGSISLSNAFNKDLKENNLADYTVFYTNQTYKIEDGKYTPIIVNDVDMSKITNGIDKYSKDYVSFNEYYSDILVQNLLTKKSLNRLVKEYGSDVTLDYPVPIMKESDYKSLMKMFNKKYIDVRDNEYIILANFDMVVNSYKPFYENKGAIIINNVKLKPGSDKIVYTAIENYNSNANDGVIVVSDSIVDDLEIAKKMIIGNYVDGDEEKIDKNFDNYVTSSIDGINIRTKLEMEAASVGMSAILTFLGLYLGIIFAISSVTVLAIGQLSESSDNKERFLILKKLGADEKMLNKALIIQIAVAFLLPLVVALIHSFFGLKELNGLIQLFGKIDVTSSIILTSILIVVIYGGYFLATYLCSKNIIKE